MRTLSLITSTMVGCVLIGTGWTEGGWLWQASLIVGGFFLGHVATEALNEGE